MNRPLFPTTLSIPSYDMGKKVGLRTYQHHLVKDGTLCTGLRVIMLNYRNIGGDGDSREVTSNGSYRKQLVLL